MGNWNCNPEYSGPVAAVARNFCPFPDYSPSPLLNILAADSSQLLSEHYASVQASLTPQQQQDFTRSLRSTFGQEGKVSYGGMGIVALSLAILFDTVAREVKGECVTDQEPMPGLFLKDPSGTYPPPVHIVSRYLRLVPHIANNPTRMRDKTERYLHELNHTGTLELDSIYAAQQYEDIIGLNLWRCTSIGQSMVLHLNRISNKTINLDDYRPKDYTGNKPQPVFNLNCDPEEATERFLTKLDGLDSNTKYAFQKCHVNLNPNQKTILKDIVDKEWLTSLYGTKFEHTNMATQRQDFDLKVKALGEWI